jgi:hypothetical protein
MGGDLCAHYACSKYGDFFDVQGAHGVGHSGCREIWVILVLLLFVKSCIRVGLLALSLLGTRVSAKAPTLVDAMNVTKESSFSQPKHFTPAAAQTIG